MPVQSLKKSSHPSTFRAGAEESGSEKRECPASYSAEMAKNVTLQVGGKELTLTNLSKVFWAKDGITKADLLQYYADVSSYLLPHHRVPGDGLEALSGRSLRQVLLPETCAGIAA